MTLVQKTILAIDDTASIRTFLRISLQAHGALFYEASTAEEGIRLYDTIKPDIVVLDLGLPDKDGLDVLPELKRKSTEKDTRIVILSVRKEQKTKDKAYALGADAYITKPFLTEDLLDVLQTRL